MGILHIPSRSSRRWRNQVWAYERVGVLHSPYAYTPTRRNATMLVRLVRMTFQPATVDQFLEQFDETAPHIRSFPGCHYLELWRDADTPVVCTTYSHWSNAEALDAYRDSDLFRSTWSTVKPLFGDRPEAHSYTVARQANAIEDAARRATDFEDR